MMGCWLRIFVAGSAAAMAAAAQNSYQPTTFPPAAYQPITGEGRVLWAVGATVGPTSLIAGAFTAGWQTLLDHPHEYGTHWDGFGKRYGMRFTSLAAGHAMEAALGNIWGEDPRYFRDAGHPLGHRLQHVVKMTFLATNQNGGTMPAYARFAGLAGSNFLSNTWRPDSQANSAGAMERVSMGVIGKVVKNTFDEFWPDIKEEVFRVGR